MPIAPLAYVMKGVINTPPYEDVTWKVYGTPDLTGAQSGYTNLINILVDYIIEDELAGTQAVAVEEQMFLTGDAFGPSNNNVVAMTGDVTGRTSANTVTKLQNRNVSSAAPTDGNSLVWVASGTDWEPKFPSQKTIAIFDSSGSWTAPTGVTKVFAFGYGGGGGGGGGKGGSSTSANSSNGGPGGGGAWASEVILTVIPGQTYTITIGAGGSGGLGSTDNSVYGTTGLTGGSTTFDTLHTWRGGQGGGQSVGLVQAPPTLPGSSIAFFGDTTSLSGVMTLGLGGQGGFNSSFDGAAGNTHIAGSSGGSGGIHGDNPDLTHKNGGGGGGGASNSGVGSAPNGGNGDPQTGPGHVPQGGSVGGTGPVNSGHGGGGGGGGGSSVTDPGGHGGNGGAGGSGRLIIRW